MLFRSCHGALVQHIWGLTCDIDELNPLTWIPSQELLPTDDHFAPSKRPEYDGGDDKENVLLSEVRVIE